MNFTLIKEHPYTTAAIVLGGGVILYLVMRGGSTSGTSDSSTQYYAPGVDPQTAQLQAQASAAASQASTYIAGLQLQGATQISLAQIGADVSKFNTGASAETIDSQTAAQLALGINTNQSIVEQSRINAGLQSKYIDAIVAAFGGSPSNPGQTQNPVVTPTPNSPTPIAQTPPPSYYSPATPTYNVPPTTGATSPGTLVPGGAPLPGGTLLSAPPVYANCDPRDSACVQRNQDTSIAWVNSNITNQSISSFNVCLENANMNIGQANHDALVSSCHSNYGM